LTVILNSGTYKVTLIHQADVAQLAEQLIRNQQVGGSIPLIGSIFINKINNLYRPIQIIPFTNTRKQEPS
jgi:hypothetical protein